MEALDLNIDNYEYKDILKLFKLNMEFGENELKKAKKEVLMMHPDKSGLDKKYFMFFSHAYKMLYSVYMFRLKGITSETKDINYENTEYLEKEENINNKELLDSLKNQNLMQPKKFNKWFNELFDKVKLENEYENNGYGNWLKSEDLEDYSNVKNIQDMNKAINNKKEQLKTNVLSKYNTINEFNNSNYCDLTNSNVESYASGMFSKLSFEDLKIAHTESVVPVTEDDYKPSYNNLEEARISRSQQSLTPLSEEESKQTLNSIKENNNIIDSHRAFKLAKQEEEINKANQKWWSSLQTIKQ